MSMDLMLRQRAVLQRAVAAVDAGGAVREEWQTVGESVPCLLERISGGADGSCIARCYFPAQADVLPVQGEGRHLRVRVEGNTYYIRSVYLLGGTGGNRAGMQVAELES